MELKFTRTYNSIISFDDTIISDFSVITGLNGSGKTHLLKAIDDGAVAVKGIDPSEVIYYNYNDFAIHNGDPAVDQLIQQKHGDYLNKTRLFSQRINTERNDALNSFDSVLEIDGTHFGYMSFHHIVDFDLLIDWSDEDYNWYDTKVKQFQNSEFPEGFMPTLRPHQLSFFHSIGVYHAIPNIRSFISTIKEFKHKADAFNLIKSCGFSKAIINWKPEELRGVNVIETELHKNLREENSKLGLSPGLLFFLRKLSGMSNSALNLSEENLLSIRQRLEGVFEEIEQYFVKSISENTLNMIKGINEPHRILDPVDVGNGFLNLYEINAAEKEYQILKKQNEYSEFENSKGRPTHFLSDEEFTRIHGDSPVDNLNRVLGEYDCNGYEFRRSELRYTWGMDIQQQQIDISLYNKTGNYNTTLDALSSGERTLLALAFTVFKLRQNKVIAKLFLMDEIDSALHPSMAKRLLNVLYNLFYKDLGINIIISTHSPSSVAFAPAHGIYVMKRKGKPRLEQSNRDRALGELTAGVPSFSVNYENRRQVFVESQYDAMFYESLYNIFQDHLNPEISLNFIPSGDSSTNSNGIGIANCDQVKKITNILRRSGNKFIWGIIDWDLDTGKEQEEYVKVLGRERRYSIENYLLDPLLVAILLWREKIVGSEFFGFEHTANIYQLSTFEARKLQSMIDAVTEALKVVIREDSPVVKSYKLVYNIELYIPEWFCRFQGHKLEEKYLTAFPKLNEIKRNKEPALKQAVIDKAIADFPLLAPNDLLDVLQQVQQI